LAQLTNASLPLSTMTRNLARREAQQRAQPIKRIRMPSWPVVFLRKLCKLFMRRNLRSHCDKPEISLPIGVTAQKHFDWGACHGLPL
jgi:hypothetical protein